MSLGKRDFLYLKNTRADALKLEGEIQEAKNQVKTSERQVEWLTKKLYDVRKKEL